MSLSDLPQSGLFAPGACLQQGLTTFGRALVSIPPGQGLETRDKTGTPVVAMILPTSSTCPSLSLQSFNRFDEENVVLTLSCLHSVTYLQNEIFHVFHQNT